MAYMFWMPNDSIRVTFDSDCFEQEMKVLDEFKAIPSKYRKYDKTSFFWTFTGEFRDYVLDAFMRLDCWVLEVMEDLIALWRGYPRQLYVIPPQGGAYYGAAWSTPSARTVYDKCVDAIAVQQKPGRTVVFWLCGWMDYGAFCDARDGKTEPTRTDIRHPRTSINTPVQAPPPPSTPAPAVQIEKRTGALSIAWIGKYVGGVAPFSLMSEPRKVVGEMPDHVMQIWGREQQNREMAERKLAPAVNVTSHYHTLEFDLFDKRADDVSEVKKQYYKLAKALHPDHNRAHNANEMFRALGVAYDFFVAAITDKEEIGRFEKLIYDAQLMRKHQTKQLHAREIAPTTAMDADKALNLHHGVFTCEWEEHTAGDQTRVQVTAVHDVQLIHIGNEVYAPSTMKEAMRIWSGAQFA